MNGREHDSPLRILLLRVGENVRKGARTRMRKKTRRLILGISTKEGHNLGADGVVIWVILFFGRK